VAVWTGVPPSFPPTTKIKIKETRQSERNKSEQTVGATKHKKKQLNLFKKEKREKRNLLFDVGVKRDGTVVMMKISEQRHDFLLFFFVFRLLLVCYCFLGNGDALKCWKTLASGTIQSQ
jgi:hypothetical protein